MHDSEPKKKRNPRWTEEELILALDFYLAEGLLDDKNKQVQQLSETLKDLAFVQMEDPEVFRNPNGVAMKLGNFAAFDPNYGGVGLTSGGKLDKVIWERYHLNPEQLKLDAAAIRSTWQNNPIPEMVSAETIDDDFYLASLGVDERTRISRSIAQRRGQRGFRNALLNAYQGQCAVTGCIAEDALEAAHILAYRGNYSNKANNGLLLRADIHTLFDLGLLSINEQTMQCAIAQKLYGTEYAEFAGAQIIVPLVEVERPGKQHLRHHYLASECVEG